jgi:ribosomal protein S18 acetylase RimI-like enzyme
MSIIRPLRSDERSEALALAQASGLFDDDGLRLVASRLDAHVAGTERAAWLVAHIGTRPCGLLYAAPEALADRVWNALMLVVAPDARGRGVGRELMRHLERTVDARLILVETSGVAAFAVQRAFYAGLGYTEVARLPDYYADGDAKVVFLRRVAAA